MGANKSVVGTPSTVSDTLIVGACKMEENLKHLAIEARARLIWGTPKSEVEEWLSSQGLPPGQVQLIIESSWRERNAQIKRLAIRDILVGCLSLIGCLLSFPDKKQHFASSGYALALLLLCFGIWRISRGIDRFLSGAKTSGAITDM
jgi:hypothetical protein